jgi:glycosyl transferase family 25
MQVESASAVQARRSEPERNASGYGASEHAARRPEVPLPTFYINRDRDADRRESVEGYLKLAGLKGERIEGVEGLAVPEHFKGLFFTGDRLHSGLKPGEVGCYASHLTAMKAIVEQGLDYALILEDDAVVPANLREIVGDVLANLPSGWDLIHICHDSNRAVKPVAQLGDGHRIVRFSRVPENATGYIMSRAGAMKFLRPIKRYWPLDTDFRQPWRFNLNIYGVAPRLIRPDYNFESSIHKMGNHSRLRRGLPIPKSYCWTGNPLHSAESRVFNVRKLGLRAWFICATHNGLRRTVRMLGLGPMLRKLRLDELGRRLAVTLAVR